MMRSMYGKMLPVFGLAKTVGTGDSTVASFDSQGFMSVMLVIVAGVFNFTGTNKVTLQLLESADNTTFTTVSIADVEGSEDGTNFRIWDSSASDASTVTHVHYRGTKRYLKATLVEAGTVSVQMGAAWIPGNQRMNPSVD